MLTENGEQDKLQSSINTTRPVTDTGSESQDIFLGMDHRTNQSCHILLIKAVTLSTVLSREIATQQPHLSENGFYIGKNIDTLYLKNNF